jgi:hypothetical protein
MMEERMKPSNAGTVKFERKVRPTEWIVELYGGSQWLAPWEGDPGRTCIRTSAKRYKSEHAAKCAIAYAKRMNPHRNLAGARAATV